MKNKAETVSCRDSFSVQMKTGQALHQAIASFGAFFKPVLLAGVCLYVTGCTYGDAHQPAPVYNAQLETRDQSIGAHMVSQGESLQAIAKNYKVTIDDILRANNLADASQVASGQRLYMPDSTSLSSMAGADVSLASPANADQTITFTETQPLEPMAQAPVEQEQLAPLDGTATAQPVQDNNDANLAAAAPDLNTPSLSTPTTTAAAPAAEPVAPAAEPVRVASAAKNLPADQWRNPASTGFRWPVRGPTLSEFGGKAGGLKNDGINIGATSGTPVEAAADGEVVYAGHAVEGFGNLILVKHKGDFVTAYGHLSRIDVVKGQGVAAGDIIGGVGQTGSVSAPQLHFQVRQGTKILNPNQFLSRNTGSQTAGL